MMNLRLQLLLIISILWLSACTGGNANIKEVEKPTNIQQASVTNVQLAIGYIKRNQFDIAKDKLYKAIEQDPKNLDAYKTMAFLMMKTGEAEEAENFYLDALDIKRNDPDLHNSYGTYLCSVNRVDDAMVEFKEAYSNPFYESPYLAYSNAGTCLLSTGNYEKAEKLLRAAVKQQPTYPGALISLAELGVKTEKHLMARAYIQRYHAVVKPTAESLWIQVQAEKALGAREHYLKYAKQLINDFPDSEQAAWVEELARNDRTSKD